MEISYQYTTYRRYSYRIVLLMLTLYLMAFSVTPLSPCSAPTSKFKHTGIMLDCGPIRAPPLDPSGTPVQHRRLHPNRGYRIVLYRYVVLIPYIFHLPLSTCIGAKNQVHQSQNQRQTGEKGLLSIWDGCLRHKNLPEQDDTGFIVFLRLRWFQPYADLVYISRSSG